jgi:small subunit ribosomal protein S6
LKFDAFYNIIFKHLHEISVSLLAIALDSHRPRGGVSMKKYETMLILKADLEEVARKANLQQLLDVFTNNGATNLVVNEWGTRELAYEINKQKRGYYVLINYEANNPGLVKEFNRICGINENVVRHLTINL